MDFQNWQNRREAEKYISARRSTLVKRTRASRPKVRSGCLTCKNRHVKCDERKPTCLRCEKAVLACGGYDVGEGWSKKLLAEADTPPAMDTVGVYLPIPRGYHPISLSGRDVTYFDLFRYQLVHDFSGYYASNFWSRTVLKESMMDPCIRHATLAIGALAHALFLSPTLGQPKHVIPPSQNSVLNEHHKFAICHYIKAVSMFRNRMNKAHTHESPRTILITTLMLVTFEMLQGNMKSADHLMAKGIVLQKPYIDQRRKEALSSHGKRFSAADELDEVAYMLPRLSLLSGYNPFFTSQHRNNWIFNCGPDNGDFPDGYDPYGGGEKTSSDATHQPTISTFDLLRSWNLFSTRCMVFINLGFRSAMGTVPRDEEVAQKHQSIFLLYLSQWRKLLESHEASATLETGEGRGLRLVIIHHAMMSVWVSCVMDRTGLSYDAFGPEFTALVDQCEAFLPAAPDSSSSSNSSSPGAAAAGEDRTFRHSPAPCTGFTFDAGVAPILSFVAGRCHVRPAERERALRLMESRLTWREGGWDGLVLAKGMRALITLEEEGSVARPAAPGEDGRGEARFIPPLSRFVWTAARWVEGQEGRRMAATYTRYIPGENGLPVQVYLDVDV